MTSSKNSNPQPGTITAIRAQTRDTRRVNLIIDGEFALGVSLDTLAHEGLFVGQALDATQIAQLVATDAYDRAKQAAIRLLELRPRSQREIQDRLRQRGFTSDTIGQVVARLGEAGLIDDQAFAHYLAEQRTRQAQRGSVAIKQDLQRHGIANHTIQQVMQSHADHTNDTAGAERHAQKLIPRLQHLDRDTFVRRLTGALQRRGYPTDVVRTVVRTCWTTVRQSVDSSTDDTP
jgi:regulatory protein